MSEQYTEYWQENEEESIPYDDAPEMVGPRILGVEDVYFSSEYLQGLLPTTAEGEMGEKLKKIHIRNRTPEDKFRDNLMQVLVILKISDLRGYAEGMMKHVDKIPDINYKSASGCLFGYMAMNLVDKKLKKSEKEEFENIVKIASKLQEKQKIGPLDIVRYGRLWKRLLTPTVGVSSSSSFKL